MSAGHYRAVLFDIGGPIDTEIELERLVDRHIREALTEEGVAFTDESFRETSRWAVEAYAADAYASIVWRLCHEDVAMARRVYAHFAARAEERRAARGGMELRDGMRDLLGELRRRGAVLGLAANQPAAAIEQLERFGLGGLFDHLGVSGTTGYRKPDVRVFLDAAEKLGVEPQACVMVGDRIDNDIAPANALGMYTVLYRTGRHIAQRPRSWAEVPSSEVLTVEELGRVLLRLFD